MRDTVSRARFMVNDKVAATFYSNGPGHLCVAFFKNKKRVGSFCAEAPFRTDYFSETTSQSTLVPSFEAAVKLAEAKPE